MQEDMIQKKVYFFSNLTPGSQTLPPGKGSGLQADDGWTQCSLLLGGEQKSWRRTKIHVSDPQKNPLLFLFFLFQNSLIPEMQKI